MEDIKYPNETIRLLTERASLRSFSDKRIPEDVMNSILEVGARAASGGNLQPYSIIRIEDQGTKEKLAELCGEQSFIAAAPTNFLFCIDWYRLGKWAELESGPFIATKSFRHFWISFQDTIIAAQNICTAADAMGLGSVYIGTVMECFSELIEMFELPEGVFPVVLLSLGYPKNEMPKPRKKLKIQDIVHNEKYHRPNDKELLNSFNEKYNNRKLEITDERLNTIYAVCKEVHGEAFAEKCINKIKQNGYISEIHRYFGLHYMANELVDGNEEFERILEKSGFTPFKKYEPIIR